MATQTTSLERLTKPVLVERVTELTRQTTEANEKVTGAIVLGTVIGLLLGAALF